MLVSGYDLGMVPPFPVVSHHQDYIHPNFFGGDPQPANLLFCTIYGKGRGTAQDDLSHSSVESLRDIFLIIRNIFWCMLFDHVGPGNCSELQRPFLVN